MLAKKGDKQGFLANLNSQCNNKITSNVINSQDPQGFTCLHYAAREGNLKIVDLLLKYNANPNIKNFKGQTALHLAVSNGYFDISKMLIKSGADLKITDKSGNSAIHLCSEKGNTELLKFLLSNLSSKEVLTKNSNKKTPMDLAHDGRILSILKDFYINVRNNSVKNVQIFNSTSDRTKHKNSACLAIKCSHISINLLNLNSPSKKKKSQFCKPSEIILRDKSKHKNVTRSSTSKNIESKIVVGKDLNLFKNNNSHKINIVVNSIKPLSTKNAKNSIFQSPLLFVFNRSNNKSSSKSLCGNNPSTTKSFHSNKTSQKSDLHQENSISGSHISQKSIHKNSSKTKKVNLLSTYSCVPKTNLVLNEKKISNDYKKTAESFGFTNSIKSSTKSVSISSTKGKFNRINSNNKCSEFLLDLDNNQAKWRLKNINMQETPKNILSQDLIRAFYNEKCFKSYSQDLNNKVNQISPPKKLKEDPIRYSKIITQNSGHQLETKNDSHNELSTDNVNAMVDPLEKLSFTKYSNGLKVNSLNLSNNTDNTRRLNENELEMTDETFFKSELKYKAISELTPRMDRIESNNTHNQEEIHFTSSFICHGLIGKGSFGEVYLVQNSNNLKYYALKVLLKSKLIDQNLLEYAITERNVLSISDHPFIVKLHYAFQTKDRLFLVLDYCPGGDLSKHLARQGRFKEEHAKFYIREMILALEDLHSRDIIYRDLKPDNIVLDKDGHAMLTDFGLSKRNVRDEDSTKSFCGSIAYLAPEMIDKKGHGKCLDWYQLGVLFFEMLVGIPPFFSNDR